MPIHALVRPDNTVARRAANIDPTVQTKAGWRWLPVETVGDVAIIPATQVKEGPIETVEATSVIDTYTVRAKTAPEIDADKAARIDTVTRDDLLLVILALENDNRLIKTKINQMITDIASTAKFTTGQANQITMAQLKNALKALL